MTIEVEVNDRRRQVVLRREGAHWVATLDARDLAVSVVVAGSRWSMLESPHDGAHHDSDVASGFSRISYDVSFDPGSNGELVVHVNGVAVPLSIVDRRHRRGRSGSGESGTDAQPKAIVAPMPGRIVRVLVQPGEAVQARQGLIVVEAMKMENELRAPRDGTVAEVRVREGASVEADAVLVVLR